MRLHEQLNDLIAAMEVHVRETAPDRVHTMFKADRHQDHRAVYHIAPRTADRRGCQTELRTESGVVQKGRPEITGGWGCWPG